VALSAKPLARDRLAAFLGEVKALEAVTAVRRLVRLLG
jgi:hypothetical protein